MTITPLAFGMTFVADHLTKRFTYARVAQRFPERVLGIGSSIRSTIFIMPKMGRPHSRPDHLIIEINAWNAKLNRQSSWLPCRRRRKCRSHYIQYNCPHRGPIVRTSAEGCHKCAHSKKGKCVPVVVEVLSPRWCPECGEAVRRSKLERSRSTGAVQDSC